MGFFCLCLIPETAQMNWGKILNCSCNACLKSHTEVNLEEETTPNGTGMVPEKRDSLIACKHE